MLLSYSSVLFQEMGGQEEGGVYINKTLNCSQRGHKTKRKS